MGKRITEFKTECYIVRERFNDGPWTVEEKDGNNIIGEISQYPANTPGEIEYLFNAFFDTFGRMELLEIAEAMERVTNIYNNK